MAVPRVDSDALARAEILVRTTDRSVSRIARETGLGRHFIARLIKQAGWARPDILTPRSPAERTRALITRAWSATELSLRAVERRLSDPEVTPETQTRDLRLLATLVHLIRDVTALQASLGGAEPESLDAPATRSLQESREELARRLAALFPDGDPAPLHE